MYMARKIDIMERMTTKSLFLLGPRQTGKTSILRNQLTQETPFYDLLDAPLFLRISNNLGLMREQLESRSELPKLVVIDEIQKLPELLDEVHLLIKKHGIRFILTGSSARKLKKKGVNLLGGRARQLQIHPLVFQEVGREEFDLLRAINRGLIPSIHFSDDPRLDLETYVGTYLDIEIANEAAVRDLPSFSRFLAVAALNNGQIINYSSIGNDAMVTRKVTREYFQILYDTQLAWEVPAWKRSQKRKPLETPKFYFFDTGVVRAILDLNPIKLKSKDFGNFFEAYIAHEIRTYLDYHRVDLKLCYWRTTSSHEVDFIVGDQLAVEVKGKDSISKRDLRGLLACRAENLLTAHIVVCLETETRTVEGNIQILPYQAFLDRLWNHELLAPQESI